MAIEIKYTPDSKDLVFFKMYSISSIMVYIDYIVEIVMFGIY